MPQLVKTPDYPSILSRIEQVRRDRGLSKSAFARTLGLTPQGYYYMEKIRKKPRLDVIIQLGSIGRVDAYWLLYGEEQPCRAGGMYSPTGSPHVELDDGC